MANFFDWTNLRDTFTSMMLPGTLISEEGNGAFGKGISKQAQKWNSSELNDLMLTQDHTLRNGTNKVTDDPWWALTHRDRLITPMGSASDSLYKESEAETGVDSTRARTFGQIGDTVAGIFGGSSAFQALGGLGGSSGSALSSGSSSGAELGIDAAGGLTSAGAPGSVSTAGSNAAYATGSTGGSGGFLSNLDWNQLASGLGQGGGGQQQQQVQPMYTPPMSQPRQVQGGGGNYITYQNSSQPGLGRVGQTLQSRLTPEQLQRQMARNEQMAKMGFGGGLGSV